jgi:acetoin utilization deacetylase AcuC-like enzyme
MATGWISHELYMWHDTGSAAGPLSAGGPLEPGEHSENPSTKRRFRNLVEVSGLLDQLVAIPPRPATDDELLRFHTEEYLARIKDLSAGPGGDAGELAPFGPGGFEIATLSAGGCLAAVDAVVEGAAENAYALVRPPGHHAEPARGRGFCIFGNVALSAMHARQVHGLGRVAVVDWDVHHGNGTELAFWSDASVLTISVHQDSCYPPGSGGVDAAGEGGGYGFNLNVPLPPGSGVGAYVETFERVVAPALRLFEPALILVASGFDASAFDPLGRMQMSSDGYRRLTKILMDVAADVCDGRLVLCHEGGYSAAYVPFCGLSVLEELSGISTGVEDPFLPICEQQGGQELQPHQEAVIAACAERLALLAAAA